MTATTTGVRQLTKASLADALERVQWVASVIVCGTRSALRARQLVHHDGFELTVHVDAKRDPDSWELF